MYVSSIHTESDFKRCIVASPVVVVDFMASWCGPCKVLGPKLETLAKKYAGVRFFKVDVDKLMESANDHNVSAMPTIILFKNGMEVERVTGANDARIEAAIKKHM